MSYILIVGAKSDIAKEIAKVYAKNGYNLYLGARDVKELTEFAQDIITKTQNNIELLELDILDYKSHQLFYNNLKEKPIGIISAVGYLGNQKEAQSNFDEAQKIIDTNYTGVMSLFNIVANDFENRKSGFIIGISSVAGERGRGTNYIYGSAKAGFTAYLSGLRNRLCNSKVDVLTVIPGFVNTQMTKNMNLPKILTAQPKDVALDIYKAQQKRKDTIYTKSIWRWIMLIIRNIPEFKFKEMKL